jgi:Leucine-rich repeat (LRR) protein
MQQKRIERETIAMIETSGGQVAYDFQLNSAKQYLPSALPHGPGWLRSFFGENFFSDVSRVTLKGGDADLARIRGLSHLKELILTDANVTDIGLESLRDLRQLEGLWLSGSQISDKGLINLAGLNHLRVLCFYDTEITDDGLKELQRLRQLHTLVLRNTKVTDSGLLVVKDLAPLRVLCLADNINVTDAGLVNLKDLASLRSLDLSGTKVTDAGVKQLRIAMPNCQISR